MIKIGSGISTHAHPSRAVEEAFQQAMLPLDEGRVSLAFLFVSPDHLAAAPEIVEALRPRLGGATLLGCTSQGTIGTEREVEQGHALSLWLAQLDRATLDPFELSVEATPDGEAIVGLPLVSAPVRAMILLADPFTFPTQRLLEALNSDYPQLPVLGGQASGFAPGRNLLILNDRIRNTGAVGVLLSGDVKVTPLVSQGCKPIGDPFVVTSVQGNVILELGGRPPLMRLREILIRMTREEQAKVLQNLHLGLVIDEHKIDPQPGDFLIRPVLQADPESGAIAVGEALKVGQTVQFQVRDAETADADLKGMLKEYASRSGKPPAGGLMFTCNGRGFSLFGVPDHDVSALREIFAALPVAGMFCGGEIGPIGGINFLHGFTASVALFEET
ncbi:MAG: FIST C-terminal domain-containing protein [Actinomycetota bacterium]|nr:FIST C-terminal domain-containing protein [Actinomycetota bacterium]